MNKLTTEQVMRSINAYKDSIAIAKKSILTIPAKEMKSKGEQGLNLQIINKKEYHFVFGIPAAGFLIPSNVICENKRFVYRWLDREEDYADYRQIDLLHQIERGEI